MKIRVLLFFFLFQTPLFFAQGTASKDTYKTIFLDSIKKSFVKDQMSDCIDKRWLTELTNQDLFSTFQNDIENENFGEKVEFQFDSLTFKQRIDHLNSITPFQFAYNSTLENVIKLYLKNRKTAFERQMALAEYYFPMFETTLDKYNIPLELKYLAIVESALNPTAKSRVGAAGLWQFMYPTGKHFNLEVTSYVDERFDPLKATEAACQYLSSLYGMFGDWSMALAAYNAGPGNVSKAIRRSGGVQDYWKIRAFLPRETANYVPAFLATMYIYEFRKEHDFKPKSAPVSYFETDTIEVKRSLNFKQVSELFDISEEEIKFLNPIYKLDIIPYIANKKHYLRLPKSKIGTFVSNETAIYAYIDFLKGPQKIDAAPEPDLVATIATTKEEKQVSYHLIKKGESLGLIANKYKVSLSQLKSWNNLKTNNILPGKKLILYTKITSSPKVTNNQYVVKQGDSLYTIAKKFPGISLENIKKWNDISGDNIQPGMKLIIKG